MSVTEIFDRYSPLIERELRSVLDDRSMPLYKMMAYHLGWLDELGEPAPYHPPQRLRPTLCLMGCEASGGSAEKAIAPAVAVELTHGFSLIHEDVQGGKPKRLKRDAVWWIWGPAQAINAGDGMHALARLSLFRLQELDTPVEVVVRALQLLDQASLKLCEGQYEDLSFQEKLNVGVDNYLKMIEGKAGALMGCACQLGALMAGASVTTNEALGTFGANLGMMRQVKEDVLALWGQDGADDSLDAEVLNKKKLLPLAYAFEKAGVRDKRRLGEVYFKRVLEPQDLEQVVAILDELGARDYCGEVADKLHKDALKALDSSGLDENSTRDLREMAQYLASE